MKTTHPVIITLVLTLFQLSLKLALPTDQKNLSQLYNEKCGKFANISDNRVAERWFNKYSSCKEDIRKPIQALCLEILNIAFYSCDQNLTSTFHELIEDQSSKILVKEICPIKINSNVKNYFQNKLESKLNLNLMLSYYDPCLSICTPNFTNSVEAEAITECIALHNAREKIIKLVQDSPKEDKDETHLSKNDPAMTKPKEPVKTNLGQAVTTSLGGHESSEGKHTTQTSSNKTTNQSMDNLNRSNKITSNNSPVFNTAGKSVSLTKPNNNEQSNNKNNIIKANSNEGGSTLHIEDQSHNAKDSPMTAGARGETEAEGDPEADDGKDKNPALDLNSDTPHEDIATSIKASTPPPEELDQNVKGDMDNDQGEQNYNPDEKYSSADADFADPSERSTNMDNKFLEKLETKPDSNIIYKKDNFVEAEDSHFFFYFLTSASIFILGYVAFHNKNKILAYALEGRRSRNGRRRPNTASYRKLNCNLEEAITSNSSHASVTNVVY